ncbi:MAG TPA: hypothetical protein DCX27_16690, partial [Balneola sp.]|nr:hypothetical protein [Balneola sp.]
MATSIELNKLATAVGDAIGGALTSAALEIEHAPTGKKVQFFQIKMTGFSDTVTPSWSEENVYGRMDPIATYQGTTRAIELSFDLGPFTESDERKYFALAKISRLMQMQYPTYASVGSATSISQPPLLEVSFNNYIRDQVCYLTQVSYAPADGMSATTVPKFNGTDILPQRISVSLSFKVLHTVAPGWRGDQWSGAPVGPIEIEGLEEQPTENTNFPNEGRSA